jgi:hypothetical protein
MRKASSVVSSVVGQKVKDGIAEVERALPPLRHILDTADYNLRGFRMAFRAMMPPLERSHQSHTVGIS